MFFKHFGSDVALASKYQAMHIHKVDEFDMILYDKHEFVKVLCTLFSEPQGIGHFKKEIDYINSFLKKKTLHDLVHTDFEQDIADEMAESSEFIYSYERDITLEQLLTTIQNLNYQ